MTEGSEERMTVRGKVPDREISEREGFGRAARVMEEDFTGP